MASRTFQFSWCAATLTTSRLGPLYRCREYVDTCRTILSVAEYIDTGLG